MIYDDIIMKASMYSDEEAIMKWCEEDDHWREYTSNDSSTLLLYSIIMNNDTEKYMRNDRYDKLMMIIEMLMKWQRKQYDDCIADVKNTYEEIPIIIDDDSHASIMTKRIYNMKWDRKY